MGATYVVANSMSQLAMFTAASISGSVPVSISTSGAGWSGSLTVRGSELNQVWTNLIDNAIDAVGEEGTITITTQT